MEKMISSYSEFKKEVTKNEHINEELDSILDSYNSLQKFLVNTDGCLFETEEIKLSNLTKKVSDELYDKHCL